MKMEGNDEGGHDQGGQGKKRPNDGDYSGSPQKKSNFHNGKDLRLLTYLQQIYLFKCIW